MRTVIVGGGKGCRAIIKLALAHFLKELPLDIVGVADPDIDAPGMIFARQYGIDTASDMKDLLSLPDISLVIELTGRDEVLENIYKIVPPGIKVFDHTFAKLFVDLANAQRDQAHQLQEITALEERIEKERLFLQSVFDNMPELVAVLDRDKRITRINAGFSQFTGFSPAAAIGKSCTDLLAASELDTMCRQTIRLFDEVLATCGAHSFVWRSPPPQEHVWEMTLTPILDAAGGVDEVISTWHRITERAVLQHKIASAELRFHSFINSAHDWISIKDLEGRYLILNKIAAESLHMKPEDFIGKRPEEVLSADLAQMIKEHDRKVIDEDSNRSFSETIPIDGREHYFQTNRFPLKDFTGATMGVCTIMRDVTSETTLRKQLEQAGRLAAIGSLAAGVAHEINNPLTGVLAFAEDLRDGKPEDSAEYEDLSVIIRETLRCRDIVKNLLDFSRQESPKFESLDVNTVVAQSLSLVRKLPEFRNIELTRHLCDDPPSIQGDPQQLQQVILNFMLNASEAMNGKGKITILTVHDALRNRCVIKVEDNGPGIPENLKNKIFEPFFSTKGTNGLGLAVSWGIIERHHGTIEVERSPTGGASFSILFPAGSEKIDLRSGD